jgi:WD40 repeat protein
MTGAQVCAADGTFGVCVCGQAAGDGSSVDVASARDMAPGAPMDTAADAPADVPPLAVDAPVAGVEAGDQARPAPDAGVAAEGGAAANMLEPLPGCDSYGTGLIRDVAISPDGTLAAMAESGGTVSVYHLPDGSLAFHRFPSPGTFEGIAFSPDGAFLLVHGRGTSSGAVVVLRSKDGGTVVRLNGATGPAAFSPDGALIAAPVPKAPRDSGGAVALWDARTGAQVRATACNAPVSDPSGAYSWAYGLAFLGDGTNFRSGGQVCSVANGMLVGTVGGSGEVTPDFKEGLFAESGTVYAVRASDWVKLRALASYTAIKPMRLLPDGTEFVMSFTTSISLRRFSDGVEIRRFDVPADPVAIAFSPGASFLASWYVGNTAGSKEYNDVGVHTIATGDFTKLSPRPGHTREVTALAYSPDGALLVSASIYGASSPGDFTVRLWRTSDGTLLWTAPSIGELSSVAISGDAAMIGAVVLDQRGVMLNTKLLSASDGALLRTLTGAAMLSFSPDGKLVATRETTNTTTRPFDVTLWNTADGTIVRHLTADPTVNSRTPSRGSFSPDGRLFAIDNNDPVSYRGVKIWSVADGVELPGFETKNAPFLAFADSESVITGYQSGPPSAFVMNRSRIQDGASLWSATLPNPGPVLEKYDGFQTTSDGSSLAFIGKIGPGLGGPDGTVHIIRMSDGVPVHAFPARMAFALSPSGKFLATPVSSSIRISCVP